VSTQGLRVTSHQDIAILTLEHPSGLPRLSRSVLRALLEALDSLELSPNCRGAVITGSETAFCVGADLEEVAALTSANARAFTNLGQSATNRVERFSKPVIAAIRGYCIGGGFDLALAAHARIAAPDAKFAHRGASLGLITGWGGTQRLPRLVGRSGAAEIFLTGRMIAAEEAVRMRIVRRVVPTSELLLTAIETIRDPSRAAD
jgi:enoyl-CoA hydratase/carnithine racemase